MNEEQAISRRQFHLAFIYGLGAAMAAALAIPAAVYLFLPPKSQKENQWVDAADLSTLSPNAPEEVVFRHNRVDGWKITSEKTTAWVVKQSDTEAIAFAPQCTHLGCAYHWDERNHDFLFPCHTSRFSIDGKVLGGPAPRPLDRYAVKIEGTRLMLGPIEKSA